MSDEILDQHPVADLLDALIATPGPDDSFTATAPDWFGDRVFGGVVIGQALSAACQTVDPPKIAHSAHATFLGALVPGPVDLAVDRLRDGRTFTTRHAESGQKGRTACRLTVSFHEPEPGDEYALSAPDVPDPESLPAAEGGPPFGAPPPFDARFIGATEPGPDGVYAATRRVWLRLREPIVADPRTHLVVAGFLSDMTGSSFRPHSLDQWGTHTDASIDHAVWFHRPFRLDEWVLCSFTPVVNHAGRSTVRGEFFDTAGHLCMSMAQELLIRPLG